MVGGYFPLYSLDPFPFRPVVPVAVDSLGPRVLDSY